jgi:sodium/bile acid cotransporter 7
MLRRQWFLVALAIVVPLGLLAPESARGLLATGFLPWLVALTLGISGFLLDTSKLVTEAMNARAIVLCLVSTYVVAPAAAYGIGIAAAGEIAGRDSPGFRFVEALMIAASQAGTMTSALALTIAARGNQELALVLTVISSAVTAIATPLALEWTVGAIVDLPVGDMMARMAWVVLVPVTIGQILRRWLRAHAERHRATLRIIPQWIILIFVWCGFGSAAEHLIADRATSLRFLGAGVALHLLLIGWNLGIARVFRLAPGVRTALVFCGSQKTLPNGIYVWQRFFPDNPYGAVPLALYHVFQLVFDAGLVPWLSAPKALEGGGRLQGASHGSTGPRPNVAP